MKEVLNQLFEIEQKGAKNNVTLFDRNIRRMFHEIEELGYYIKNPEGEKFSEERTDIDATMMGTMHSKMKITKVLKPIIYQNDQEHPIIIQKGVVIVE